MKVLVVGLGSAGQRHARNLRTILGDEAEISVLRSRCPYPGERPRERYQSFPEVGIAKVFYRIDDAFAEAPQAVVIANPSSLHLPVAWAAAEAGCAVFIEKPLSDSWEGVPELLGLVERKRLTTMVGYQWRFHPMMAWLKEYLEGRPLGRVVSARVVCGEYLPGWHPGEDYRTSYASRRDLGGGVLLTQIHEFDYLGWLIGWPRDVYAVGGHLSSLEVDVEDVVTTLMRCPVDGRDIPVTVHHDYLARPPARTCEILCDGGSIQADLLRSTVQVWTEGPCVEEHDFSGFLRNDMFRHEMQHFLDCVTGADQPIVPAREGARSLAVALAARRSLESGRPEEVTYA